MRIHPIAGCALALALLSPAVLADDMPVSLGGAIVVTATRSPQKLSDTLAAMTVLTRMDIEASGAIDLPTLLQGLTGVEVSQGGGFGTQSAVRLRGAEADHTLVLVDGLRLNSVSAGTTAIEHIPLASIDRIEIVRGNVSSVYGEDAIGGVIRIFTREGRGAFRPRLAVAAGNDGYTQLDAGVSGAFASCLALDLSAGRTRSGGFSAVKQAYIPTPGLFTPADADDDDARNTHFNLHVSQQLGNRLKLGLTAMQARANVEYDGSVSNHAQQNLSGYSLYAEGKPLEDWTSRLTLGQGADHLDNDLDGTPTDYYHSRINQAVWENTLALSGQLLRFGLEAQNQLLESNQVYSATRRSAVSPYAGFNYSRGAHELDLGVRYDRYSDFGGHATGRIAYGYAVTPALKMFGSLANAFKAPSFNDLYLDYPPFYYANPGLKPEHSRSAEAGFSYSAGAQFVQAALFASRTHDLIAIDPVSFSTTVNLDKSRNHGLELSWKGSVAGMKGHAALTLQNPEDAGTGLALLRRAQRFGSAGLSDRVGKFGWQVEMVAAGPHPDVHVTTFTRVSVPGYARFDLSGDYALARDWKLRARVLNALDADYSLAQGYATPGRQFRLELSWAPDRFGAP